MPREFMNTNYKHIMACYDPKKGPFFLALVNDALDKIYSKPVGKKLIDAFQKHKGDPTPQRTHGYLVAIVRMDIKTDPEEFKKAKKTGCFCAFGPGSNTDGHKNTISAVKWNPNMIETPDGERPCWVGLAHELIHAWHNLKGTCCWVEDRSKDEHQTTGLYHYALGSELAHPISENAIRAEHGFPLRETYNGHPAPKDYVVPKKGKKVALKKKASEGTEAKGLAKKKKACPTLETFEEMTKTKQIKTVLAVVRLMALEQKDVGTVENIDGVLANDGKKKALYNAYATKFNNGKEKAFAAYTKGDNSAIKLKYLPKGCVGVSFAKPT